MTFSTRLASSLLRRAVPSARTLAVRSLPASTRSFSVLRTLRKDEVSESHFGPGGTPGVMPTDLEQATGLERLELLGDLEGKPFFDLESLLVTHMGTPANPIIVKTVDDERLVACTGYPEESHEITWLTVDHQHSHDRCPECGCTFKHEYVEGRPADHGQHH